MSDDDTRVRADERRRLLAEFELERNQLLRNIETCRLRDFTHPFIGEWSVLDIVDHVAKSDAAAAATLRAYRGGRVEGLPSFSCDEPPTPTPRDVGQLSPALERLQQTRDALVNAIAEFSDEELTAEGSFPPQLIQACTEHDKLHWHDIAAKLAGMAAARRNGPPGQQSPSSDS